MSAPAPRRVLTPEELTEVERELTAIEGMKARGEHEAAAIALLKLNRWVLATMNVPLADA